MSTPQSSGGLASSLPGAAAPGNPQTPRPAATIVLLRDAQGYGGVDGFEVLLLRRHDRSGFAAGAWVFPGGVVEPADIDLPATRFAGISPGALAPRFADDAAAVLGFHVAAARETFEEAGILLAAGDVGEAERTAVRRRLGERGAPAELFVDFLAAHDLVLRLDALTYLSRWITPRVEGRRFDTVFFLAALPGGQQARHDDVETTAKRWVRPRRALQAHRAGDFPMIHPTVVTLEWLADCATAGAAIDRAAQQEEVPWILPHVERGADGSLTFMYPGDPGFPHDRYADELRGPTG